ncbi:hypothetical protein [Streptomyces aidingensis]|uniref:Terminase small subunit n=1 Tax=Streptomyces aidingensis TaxID=910347 RepID=A0A1I1PWI1_9ACTN|nr:hypothetical protein [Streptomyces aidingensis]SFD14199.1 hypothetical protein SAMN05421773_110101 [Streptomyces aidingensis]
MAGFGPPPSENKRRRNADTFEGFETTVPTDSGEELRGPELPHAALYGPQTIAWYDTWRRSPQSAAFLPTDWQRLLMLAPLVDAYFLEPSTKLLAEIRLNEGLLGATHTDRLRARIKVEAPKPKPAAPPAGVADLTSRRRRLTDAS